MTDKEAWERPAVASLYNWILTVIRDQYSLKSCGEAASWASCKGNSHGYSPFFLDYCQFLIDNPEQLPENKLCDKHGNIHF
jgi:hypothetical protein